MGYVANSLDQQQEPGMTGCADVGFVIRSSV